MHVDQAIRERRTVRQFKPDPIPRAILEEILELATWAPNHRQAEPWRFYVATGEARRPLADIHRQICLAERPHDPEAAERRFQEIMAIPALVMVTYRTDQVAKRDQENYAAVCCALQNLALAAHVRGLGIHWRTGNVIRDPRTRAWLNLGPDEQAVGLIHLGYPRGAVAAPPRTPVAAKTVFLEG